MRGQVSGWRQPGAGKMVSAVGSGAGSWSVGSCLDLRYLVTHTSHQGGFSHAVNVGNKIDHGQSSQSDSCTQCRETREGRVDVLNVLLRS